MLNNNGYFKSSLTTGRSGDWLLERFTVNESSDYDFNSDERPECAKRRPGTYTQLLRGGTVYMTDLYDEWWTQKIAIAQAHRRGGQVLITGLGIGLVVEAILKTQNSAVENLTVIEYSADVINLVAPQLLRRYGKRLQIIHADAFHWQPPLETRFSMIWHDIWPSPYGDEVRAEMRFLQQRYRSYCDWQGFWPEEYDKAYQLNNDNLEGKSLCTT